jgi:glycosyltransferase involved in cell wall biosynthesis
MCTYNGARFLDEQLRSIQLQSRPADEMVICDDGSNDDTIVILKRFLQCASFKVTVIQNELKLGSTNNFSKAMLLSSGDLIVLTDQDDIWQNDKIESIEKAFLEDASLNCLFSDANLINEDGKLLKKTLWQTLKFTNGKKEQFRSGHAFNLLLRGNFITGATMCFKSSWKNLALPVPNDWVHDYWIALFISASSKISFIDKPLIKYRCHPQQQLGLRSDGGKGLARWWWRFNTLEAENYLQAAQKISELGNRLSHYNHGKPNAAAIQCEKLSEHLVLRGRLPKNRLKRLPVIFKEIINGNYFRLSLGIKSISRDFFSSP